MYAERVTLTRPTRPSLSERVRLATMLVGVAVVAAVTTNALQWPLWGISPLLASINTALSVAHATTAPLLRESGSGPIREPLPWAFGIAGVCRSGTWITTWDPQNPWLHLVGTLLNSSFWLLVIGALLLWSNGPANHWEKRYFASTAVILVMTDVLLVVTDSAKPVRILIAALSLVLVVLFIILAVRRTSGARGLERRALRMAQVPALFAIPGALATGSLLGTSAKYLLPAFLGIALMIMPVTIVVTMIRAAAERANIADAVTGLSWPASPRRLRSALQWALQDPTIELGYWVPGLDRYVDAEGRRVPEPAHDRFAVVCQDERLAHDHEAHDSHAHDHEAHDSHAHSNEAHDNAHAEEDANGSHGVAARPAPASAPAVAVTAAPAGSGLLMASYGGDSDGVGLEPANHPPGVARSLSETTTALPALEVITRPVAMLIGGPQHHLRPDLVASAMQAAGPALALAGLQAGLRAERLDLAAVHREVEESRWAERRRLEQNLHDGAQHRLAALTMRLGAACATVPLDARAKDLVGQIQDEIREVLRELREVADGIHPTTLTEAGLGPALEAVAERFPVRVTITAPARRFPPVVEAVAYYSTTEVLTIVTRQLSVSAVRVEVSTRGGDLWVRTTGQATDARPDLPRRYLTPLGSGIRAIGGELLLPETTGTAFTVAARIPCE